VIVDPNHDFLREIREQHWSAAELPFIMQFAPNCNDRQEAMNRLLIGEPTMATLTLVADQVRKDKAPFPIYSSVSVLGSKAKPEFRSLWMELLAHPNFDRRAEAVTALAALPPDPATTQKLRSLINDQEPIRVVVNSINALAKWDAKANADVFQRALKIQDRRNQIRNVAQRALNRE
jgi:HEAT repeat protein